MSPSSPLQRLPTQTPKESLCELYRRRTEKLFKGYEHQRPINRVTRNTRKLSFKKIERNEIQRRSARSTVKLNGLKLELYYVLGND